jgi:hypothetical protein
MTSRLLTRAEAAAFCRCSVDAFDEHVPTVAAAAYRWPAAAVAARVA